VKAIVPLPALILNPEGILVPLSGRPKDRFLLPPRSNRAQKRPIADTEGTFCLSIEVPDTFEQRPRW